MNYFRGASFLGNHAMIVGFNRPNNRREYRIMGKKLTVIASAVLALGFASVPRSNAGTEMIEPYSAPRPTYNYAPPPPRPVFYAPPPVVGVVVGPAYGFYGPRFGAFRAQRFYGHHAYWRSHRHWH
jgi:hypothetical protein